jgi:hypothetical protein
VVRVKAAEVVVVLRVLVRRVLPGILLAVLPVAAVVWLPRVAEIFGNL